ncbi:hypothetical protein LEP1GSC041_2742 [Leptospira noguchii str. 2006001870]|uniref:Uncharacterized protein n=1 Tax=Leptospira noguchii serovar Autumnalis str. ZUN142 TaxID=1085540 RepID=M6U9N7_9LEPT|nr:hypothetical protein LEP1GSC041_2742 [Leptospira noguchii str. 2006001870]EMO41225.1 hypothetical protein LEP1GSC186_2970 [Leptospira noguchii serovar Autumnalis str. ZUN142]
MDSYLGSEGFEFYKNVGTITSLVYSKTLNCKNYFILRFYRQTLKL